MTIPAWNLHRDRLLSQFNRLKSAFLFDDVDVKLEAYWAELKNRRIECDDPCFQEAEYKAELYAHFEDDLRTPQSDAAAAAVIAMYHHWERSVKWLVARKNSPNPVKGLNDANFDGLKAFLQFDGLSDACKATFGDLDLGRLIANVIKHGKGNAEATLRATAPDLFQCTWDDPNFDRLSRHGVNLIWVQPSHVYAVARGIEAFWLTLPDDAFPPTYSPSLEHPLETNFE